MLKSDSTHLHNAFVSMEGGHINYINIIINEDLFEFLSTAVAAFLIQSLLR